MEYIKFAKLKKRKEHKHVRGMGYATIVHKDSKKKKLYEIGHGCASLTFIP